MLISNLCVHNLFCELLDDDSHNKILVDFNQEFSNTFWIQHTEHAIKAVGDTKLFSALLTIGL